MAPPTSPAVHRLHVGDPDDEERHPYTLVPFPHLTGVSGGSTTTAAAVAAFGGDDGTVYLLPPAAPSSSGDARADSAAGANAATSRAVRTFDDPIRSIAPSSDGRRVAVGFDDGSTRIFAYDDYTTGGAEEDGAGGVHPFLSGTNSGSGSGPGASGDDDEDDGFDGMMTQNDQPDAAADSKDAAAANAASSNNSNKCTADFAGPRFDAPVRSLSFLLPPSSTTTAANNPTTVKYHLAIASESSPGFCIVDVTTESSLQKHGKYLAEEADTAHEFGGVRGVSCCGEGYVATLGQDGRLCTWTASTGPDADPTLDWDVNHVDKTKAVLKADVGELSGADVIDRASMPVWSGGAKQGDRWLALPGRSDVQLRKVGELDKEKFICSIVEEGDDGGGVKGHSDVIVTMAFSPDDEYLVTGGRDGRVVVWRMTEENGQDNDAAAAPGEFVRELPTDSASYPKSDTAVVTSMIWTEDETAGGDALRLAYSDGSVVTVTGRDNIVGGVPSERATANKAAADDVADVAAAGGAASDDDATVSYEEGEEGVSPGLETQPPVPSAVGGPEEVAAATTKKRLSKKKTKKNKSTDDGTDDDDDDIDFGAEEDGVGNGAKAEKGNRFVADEADEDGDDDDGGVDEVAAGGDDGTANDAAERPGVDAHQDTFDDGEFPAADADDDLLAQDDIPPYQPPSHMTTYDAPEMQPAFAPSSTPLSTTTTRILCWNHVGTVTLRDDGPTNTVDVSFVDGAFRRPVTFTDNLNFIVGSLGEDGGVFASDVADDYDDDIDLDDDLVDGLNMSDATKRIVKRSTRKKGKKGGDDRPTGSSVYFHRFETFGPLKDKDWVLTLPDGELALGCACGEGWAAVATSRRFLRLYTSGGNQGPVTWLKGDLVTMVGRGRFLAVFYHESTPLPDGTQRLGYQLLDAVSGNLVHTGSVSSVSSGSTLSWAGFSNECALTVMDSDGMLSMLVCTQSDDAIISGGWEWSPMLDTVGHRKSADDSFWPVTVQDGKLVCVPLKGGNEHPDAVRRPVTTTLGLRMPLARGTLAKSNTLEEVSVRANFALRQKKFVNDSIAPDDEDLMAEYDKLCAQVDKVTLKLFFSVIEAGKVERALDLVERLHLEASFDIAIKASDRFSYTKLCDRIEMAKESKFPPLPMDDDVDDQYFAQEHPERSHDFYDRSQGDESIESTAITPDVKRRRTKDAGMKRGRNEAVDSDGGEAYEGAPEEEEDNPPPKRRMNPFAKKRLESPARTKQQRAGKENDLASPLRSPSAKPALSRTSTFSAQSRARTKVAKRIL